MIRRIGVIYQDVYSLGFIKGLQRRLRCDAELVSPPPGVGRTQFVTRKQARQADVFFQSKGVDIIVRFTDADRSRWQEVRSKETHAFPPATRSRFVCGVAVNNPEEWLCEAPEYLAEVLGTSVESIRSASDRSSFIKNAVARCRQATETTSAVIERIVADAPSEAFKKWLSSHSFKAFYSDCRAQAALFGCETPNEL